MELTIEEVFEAYYECRKTKKYSKGALEFEIDYESKLVDLFYELKNNTYKPCCSNCFIIKKPVPREIFAAPFRDRIVHHILIRRLNPYFEKYFIFDSYACRVGKGTFAAIKRAEHFMKSVSQNNTKTAYVLKMDIKGFFMSINKNVLYKKLLEFINKNYSQNDSFLEKELCRKIVFNNPCKNCIRKSPKSAWEILPKDKSLFTTKLNCGLPIGNLTSQVFANFYLSEFDHFVKHDLQIKYYIRYVDDALIFSNDIEILKSYIPKLNQFLKKRLKLTLHPKKLYIQNINKGFSFLGANIKPYFTDRSKRVKENFNQVILKQNKLIQEKLPSREDRDSFLSSVNSYLGLLKHFKTYEFRVKLLKDCLNKRWRKFFGLPIHATKLKKRTK